jgi:hypothetical protein
MRAFVRSGTVIALMLATAVAGTGAQAPAAAKADPVYDVAFTTGPAGQEAIYKGTTTFTVDAKGAVTGKMAIVEPTTVRATLSGQIDKGVWTFAYSYEMPDQGCTGTLKGTATVPADRKAITGTAVVGGDCAPEPMNATFSFSLKPAK